MLDAKCQAPLLHPLSIDDYNCIHTGVGIKNLKTHIYSYFKSTSMWFNHIKMQPNEHNILQLSMEGRWGQE